jgi:hypothetical protein
MFYKTKKTKNAEKKYNSLSRDYYSMEKYADEMREKNVALYKIIKKQDQEILDMKVKHSKLEESKIPRINLFTEPQPKPIKCFNWF